MGNTALCKSGPCTTNPKPVYKTVLGQIFSIAFEKTGPDTSSNKSFSDTTETNLKLSSDTVDVPRLEAHVKSHIKALIDYLEGNHKKLIDTGTDLNKRITGSINPIIHMLGLLTIIELFNASSKFSHDKNFLTRLRQRGKNDTDENGKDSSANKIPSEQNKPLDSSFTEEHSYQNFKDNIVQFENNVIEILIFLLDPKSDTLQKPIFKHVLKTFDLYLRNHVGNLSMDKLEVILDRLFAVIEPYQTFGNKEDLEIQLQFSELLISVLASYHNISFKFKHRFISHSCNTLKNLYEINQKNSSMEQIGSENKKLMQDLSKSSFALIETVTHSVFDLNEFGVLITPLLAFFDNIEWKNTQLQIDIFMSLMETMSNSSFEQVEIFLIDKIVEYVDYDKYNNKIAINPFKHNEKIEVRIRVFSLLATIFERTKKTFLSFLVIDNIILSIMNNLKHLLKTSKSEVEANQFREAIYICQKRFIDKLNSSSKNLSQLIDSIGVQLFNACFKENRNDQFIEEILNFFYMTIDYIQSFPGQYNISKDCISIFMRIRGVQQLSQITFKPVEKLLNIKFQPEEVLNIREVTSFSKRSDLLNCPPDIAFAILSNCLSTIKNIVETGKEKENTQHLLSFIQHCTKVNESLLLRKDILLLIIVLAFIKKIMALSNRDNTSKHHKGLLLYILVSFLQNLQNSPWALSSLAPKISTISKVLPLEALQALQSSKEPNALEAEEIISYFEDCVYTNPHDQQQEYDVVLHLIANDLKSSHSHLNFEYLNEDFDDLSSIYGVNAFASIGEIELSLEHQKSQQHADGTPRPVAQQQKKSGGKGESLLNIHQVHHHNNSFNRSSFVLKQDENIYDEGSQQSSNYLDQSFENALKEARKTVKTNNLSKILNNQI